jgi:hypothetical protein
MLEKNNRENNKNYKYVQNRCKKIIITIKIKKQQTYKYIKKCTNR